VNLKVAKAVDRVVGSALARAVATADAVHDVLARPPAPIDEIRGVLVTRLWGVGNWALLRPVVRDLRERWPRTRFHALTLETNRPLVEDLVDQVHAVRPSGLLVSVADLLRARARLAAAAPTISLDFEPFATVGALVARAAGIPQRLGFAGGPRGRDGLWTVRVPFRRDAHASRSFRDLAEAAGVEPGPYVPGGLAPTAAGRAEAARAVPEDGRPLVVLHPGSGDNFPGRRWSEAGFAAAGRLAAERHGAGVAVTGGASEASLVARVAAGSGPGAVPLAGRLTLQGLIALLSRATVLVSNDTGPVHLASALGRPVVALFGPNTPVLYGPLSPGSRAFYRALPCSPCLTVESYRSSRCRIPTCMRSIATGEVLAAVSRALAAAGAPAAGEETCAAR
jgi:ADP-heptose:LPS heptosyltransferase